MTTTEKKELRREIPLDLQRLRRSKLQLAPSFPLTVRPWTVFVGAQQTYESSRLPRLTKNTSPVHQTESQLYLGLAPRAWS